MSEYKRTRSKSTGLDEEGKIEAENKARQSIASSNVAWIESNVDPDLRHRWITLTEGCVYFKKVRNTHPLAAYEHVRVSLDEPKLTAIVERYLQKIPKYKAIESRLYDSPDSEPTPGSVSKSRFNFSHEVLKHAA